MAIGLLNRLHSGINQLYSQGQGRYFPPDKKDEAINSIQIELFEELVEEYQRTQRLSDYLLPFQDFKDQPVAGGFANLPIDYGHMTGLQGLKEAGVSEKTETDISGTTYTETIAKVILDGEWGERVNDPVLPPELEFPIVRMTKNKIQVEPKEVPFIRISYIKVPTDAIWGFTMSSDGRSYIYDSNTTTELVWPVTAFKELLKRSIAYLGIPMKDSIGISYKNS